MRARAIRCAGAAAGAALLLSLLCAAAAPAADRGPFWWAPAEPVAPPGEAVDAIACPSESLCVATAGQRILTSTDPTGGSAAWRVDHVDHNQYDACGIPGTCPARLTDVECLSTSLCLAVDSVGYLFTSTDPAAGGPSWSAIRLDTWSFRALDCASLSLCVIVGNAREALTSTNPRGGAGAWRAVTIDAEPCPSFGCGGPAGFASVLDVACPTVERCIAVNLAGFVLSSTAPAADPGPWRSARLTSDTMCGHVVDCASALTAVTCPSPTTCLTGGVYAFVFVSENPTGPASAWTAPGSPASTATPSPAPRGHAASSPPWWGSTRAGTSCTAAPGSSSVSSAT